MIARAGAPMSPLIWLGAPTVAVLAASLVLATPVRIAGLQAPEPVFALVPAFAWAMARPSVLPPFMLVLLGLGLDLLWGAPLGLWPTCLLAAFALVFAARRILSGQEFWGLWAWYAAACAVAMTVGLLLVALRAGRFPSLIGTGAQFGVTLLLFPFAWRLVERYEASDTRYR
jgi:rod shape-determining protein MreD